MKLLNKLVCLSVALFLGILTANASSHREAPLIADDPLADNCDLYAFRSPDKPNTITIIATYVPLQLPQGGPNYYSFGEGIRYEIHIDNNTATPGDDIIYRVTFTTTNQDPTTFFNIRLGQRNLLQRYKLERSMDGGSTWTTILQDVEVPPTNIGSRSINSAIGLHKGYGVIFNEAIKTALTGESVFVGPTDDPFFVDLGGVFDLGDMPRQTSGNPRDGLACKNVSTIAIQIPIDMLLKPGTGPAANILDGNYTIGVWASASRQAVRTLTAGGQSFSGNWIQVSRLGMPLTNEAVIPVGSKDFWNALTPYQDLANISTFGGYFYNPELALYMDDALFGGAVPAFGTLRVQRNALGAFDFGNTHNGLFALKGTAAVAGTALDDAIFGTLLLPGAGKPRSVDLWPIFHTGVPNLRPYQLATGKPAGNPLAAGKPFINNFLPNGGDMLRLNMAVPPTKRHNAAFSSEGLINAAVLGLTTAPYNTNTNIEFIPNMDGFPNGRRLEDDVTRIELQAVGGVALAAIGLWYDDYTVGGSPLTPKLLSVLGYTTGVEANDKKFRGHFPYVALPHAGTSACAGTPVPQKPALAESTLGFSPASVGNAKTISVGNFPNPFSGSTTLTYVVENQANVTVEVFDQSGKLVQSLLQNEPRDAGQYELNFDAAKLPGGVYYARVSTNAGKTLEVLKMLKI